MSFNKRLIFRKDFRRALFCCGIIAGITFIAFLPSLNNGFTNWDDDPYVVNNPDIKGMTPHNLAKIFSSGYVGNYQPLTMLAYMAEYRLFTLDPAAYHCANLFLHIINCLLVFMLIYGLSGSCATSFIVGLLFGIHPLRVESVAWIAELKDVLSSCFYFISLLFYIRFIKIGGRKPYWLCAVSLVFSLLSKPMAVSQPLILLLIDYVSGKKPDKDAVQSKIPFFGISAVFVAITLCTQVPGAKSEYLHLSFLQQVITPFYGTVFYLVKTVFPARLCAFYPFPATLDMKLLACPFLVIFGAAAVWRFRTRSRKLIFGSLFFIITALPVLQIVRIGNAIVAERYTYVPMLGIYFIVAALVTFLLEKKFKNNNAAKTLLLSGVALPVIAFAFVTHERCRVWNNSFSLWNDVIRKIPSVTAYSLRGAAYSDIGDYDHAIEDYTNSIELDPTYAQSYCNRGVAFCDKGDYDRAIEDHTYSIKLDPTRAQSYYSRGIAFCDKGDYDRAIEDYNKAIRLNFIPADAYYNRGLAYKAKGDDDRAIQDYTHAICLDPGYAAAYNNRGLAYHDKGDYGRAIQDYSEAIRIDPSFAFAYSNRGLAYCDKGDYDRAIEEHTRAIRLDPAYAPAYGNRGFAYFRKGDYDRAVEDDTRAIRLDPGFAQAYSNRGIAYSRKGNYNRAIEDISQAILLSPAKPDAYFNRGLVYKAKGDKNSELADLKKACGLGYEPACNLLRDN